MLFRSSILREWYDTAKSYTSLSGFDQTIKYWEKINPVFIENFGGAVENSIDIVGRESIVKAVKDFARNAHGELPKFPDGSPRLSIFFDVVPNASTPSLLNLDFVKKQVPIAAKNTVKEIKNYALAGAGIYIGIIAIMTGLFLFKRK